MANFNQIDASVKTYVASHVHIALAVVLVVGIVIGHFV